MFSCLFTFMKMHDDVVYIFKHLLKQICFYFVLSIFFSISLVELLTKCILVQFQKLGSIHNNEMRGNFSKQTATDHTMRGHCKVREREKQKL